MSLSKSFDLIYLADSIEHLPRFRRAPLWRVLAAHAHKGTKLYLHYPNPPRQRLEAEKEHVRARSEKAQRGRRLQQYFEEVVLPEALAAEAKCHGFNLVRSEDHGKGKPGYISTIFQKASVVQ